MPENIHPYQFQVSAEKREELLGQKGVVLWLTGLSGSGKSTIANQLSVELHQAGKLTFVLDGDVLRSGLNKDLGFTEIERTENLRRAAEVAAILRNTGAIVICTFIAPLEEQRKMIQEIVGSGFILCFVDCPVEDCQKRDPKGLYAKAVKGEIQDFTGISAPYEKPVNPDIRLNTSNQTVEECVEKISSYLRATSLI
jgi:adenylylsulfate kinase